MEKANIPVRIFVFIICNLVRRHEVFAKGLWVLWQGLSTFTQTRGAAVVVVVVAVAVVVVQVVVVVVQTRGEEQAEDNSVCQHVTNPRPTICSALKISAFCPENTKDPVFYLLHPKQRSVNASLRF